MPFSKKTRPELLLARYHSLLDDVPVAIFTALSATVIQMMALQHQVDWQFSTMLPLVRMTLGGLLLFYWFCYRDDNPEIETVRKRLQLASVVLMIAGVATLVRSIYLFGHTDHFGHYFLIFHTTLYGICFAFILSKIGIAAYVYNVLLVAAAIACTLMGHFEHPQLLVALIVIFEVGMLIAMQASGRLFDQWVSASYETRSLLEENQRLANQDSLTHLPNRRQFFMHVEERLASAKSTGEGFAVGIVDLDNFKPVNDAYGHHIGDLVLVEVASRLSAIDMAQVRFYRLGGDEFAFQTMAEGQLALEQLGREINRAVSPPMNVDGILISIKASIGVCPYTRVTDTAQGLYEHADFALYHIKRTGRGNMQLYSQTLEEERLHLNKIDQALRAADLEKELFPVFQPIVNVHTGTISSFESLARWHHPAIGAVPPALFIAVAESLGMISDITLLMFRKSIVVMHDWPAPIRLSFNLSAYDVTSKSVVTALIDVLAKSGIAPSRVIFEITETGLLQDFATARANIELIREAGARIALDDFGTGYSSLSHIQNLPLDKLKIDRSFIKDIETNPTSQNIVRSIVALCQGMQIECVAEGAETENQVRYLQGIGCQLIQGYYYSRPMPQAQILPYLAERLPV